MNNMRKIVLAALTTLFFASAASAATVKVSKNIDTSTTWTADNVYRLEGQIFILHGASLTIEAGTVIASTTDVGGSLAVARGAKIFVNGTEDKPVIMTSTDDVATWEKDSSHPSGGDPKTGKWREGANEWGNLTIMGEGVISASHSKGLQVGSNTKDPSGLNEAQMEGLTDANYSLYGGADDNDDSGSISYLSLRYAGKVVGLGNELNGLSLGGIGRETDIDHVEIMNNVDDGIEIWGGTVNLKYVSIWNVGDDSFDVDQGWRGKAQFLFVVQGYSVDAKQGSGVGDNCFEMDGAEDSDAQPVTTSVIYNATVIGNPLDGDHGTAWRDNARVQFRNCIFMDLGEKLVKADNDDGDGANGYGYNGTLSWEKTWETDYTVTSTVNDCGGCPSVAFNNAGNLYTTQTSGKLAEITDSVFFRNLHADAYTDSDTVGVTTNGGSNSGKNNVVVASTDDKDMPIVGLTRGTTFTSSESKGVLPVKSVDPRAANDALVSADTAPNDGFFTPVQYRGAFSADDNWLQGWTAADAYGFIVSDEDENPDANPAKSITVSPSSLTMDKGDSADVTITLADKDGNAVEGNTVKTKLNSAGKKRVSISSNNEETDENGEAIFTVTAKKKGKAVITFQSDNLKEKLKVKVKK